MTARLPRILPAFATAVVPTLFAYRVLDTEEYLPVLLGYVVVVVALSTARLFIKRRVVRIVLRTTEIVVQTAAAVLIVFSLNVTPASAYLAWFSLVKKGEVSGILSVLFALKVAFFSAVAGTAVLRRDVTASVSIAGALTALVLYAVFQEPGIMIASLVLGLVAFVAVAVARVERRSAYRLIPLLLVATLSAGIALPLAQTGTGSFSPIIDVVPTGFVTGAITTLLPDFPFLYNMPGYGHNLGEKEIGSQPSLTERPVFEITGSPGETVYLRTDVFDYFTGKGWARRRTTETAPKQSRLFTTDPPSSFDRPLRVEVLIDFFSSVPHTLNTEAINFFEGSFPPLGQAGFDTGFIFQVPVVKGTVFFL